MARATVEHLTDSRQVLKILIVEDNPADARLTVAILERAGHSVSFEVVESPEGFEERLQRGDYDVILADYNLRTWTALDALAILQKSGRDIPFILVTGSLGDEAAVECIKQGAADYVLKDRLQRLPVAVRRAREETILRAHRAAAEEALQKALQILQALIDASPAPILTIDPQGKVLLWNPACERAFGWTEKEVRGRPLPFVPEDQAEEHLALRGRAVSDEAVVGVEVHGRRKDGTHVVLSLSTAPIKDSQGSVSAIVAVMEDISERKRAEEALRESEEHFRSLFENMLNGFAYCRMLFEQNRPQDFIYIKVNSAFEALTGLKNAVGKKVSEVIPGIRESDPELFEIYGRVASTGIPERFETYVEALGMWFSISVYSPKKGYFVAVFDVITERKRAEEALRASEARYRQLFERNLAGVFRVTLDGRILNWNPTMTRIFGYTSQEVRDINAVDFYFSPGECQGCLERLQEHKTITNVEVRFRRKDGAPIWTLFSAALVENDEGKPEVIEGTLVDITERKNLEEQFRQSQKMEAVGRLAGGVAHDFNNLLTAIMGYSELVLSRLGEDSPHHRHVEEIRKAGERAASLTRQLLAFSRHQVLAPQVMDLNSRVANIHKMLCRLIGEDIELTTQLAPDLGHVKADPGQMEQVILNLAVNSRDAMPKGGKLVLQTTNVELNEERARQAGITPGPGVLLSMKDTGCGMDWDTLSHIFEPFFTTKAGKGTGLGMATVYGIVKQSGGHIWVESAVGQGTTVNIYLPRVAAPLPAPAPLPQPRKVSAGNETILLVEDEDAVRGLVRQMLQGNGYTVLEANGASQALSLAERYAKPIHLMLTDVIMPQMSGPELATHLAPMHPETRVLYMSGYTDDALAQHGLPDSEAAYLQKPFTPDALAEKLRGLLGASPSKPL